MLELQPRLDLPVRFLGLDDGHGVTAHVRPYQCFGDLFEARVLAVGVDGGDEVVDVLAGSKVLSPSSARTTIAAKTLMPSG